MMNNEQKIKNDIIFLSEPSKCFMADAWYGMATADHFWVKWRHDVFRKLVPREYLSESILEVGCGASVARKMIEDEFACTIDGCDLNLVALKKSVPAKGRTYFYNIHDRNGEFYEKFSTIILLDVLEHITDPVSFLKSICFHLKPGGNLIINVPAFQAFYSRYDEVAGHMRRYNRKSLINELIQAGLIIQDSSYWGMSLVPVLLLRKFVVLFLKKEKVIQTGFNPEAKIVDVFFQGLRALETSISSRAPFGTSLFAVAKKEGHHE